VEDLSRIGDARLFSSVPTPPFGPVLRPFAEAVAPFDPVSVYDKLELLVGAAVGDTFHALLTFQHRFWSFVEAPERRDQPRAA